MEEKIPTYYITIDPQYAENDEWLGISQIAYTPTPAIEVMGLAFNAVKQLRFIDELKGIVASPALIPDMPIRRYDEEFGYYDVVFTADDILMMVEMFNRDIKSNQFNLDHDSNKVAPAFMLYNWIIEDPETDLSLTKYGVKGLKKGTWFTVSKFTDMEFFKSEIIEGGRNGLSVEGIFALALKQIKQNYNKQTNKNEMKLKFEIKKLEDGTPIWVSSLEVGAEVYTIDENLDKVAVFDGTHILENGDVVSTVDGKITEIKPKAEAEEMTEEVQVEETVEEMAELPVVEEVPVVEAPAEDLKSYIDAKINDLLNIIAELKSEIENKDVEEDEIIQPMDASKNKAQALSAYFSAMKRR
jgi:hypothetical protein